MVCFCSLCLGIAASRRSPPSATSTGWRPSCGLARERRPRATNCSCAKQLSALRELRAERAPAAHAWIFAGTHVFWSWTRGRGKSSCVRTGCARRGSSRSAKAIHHDESAGPDPRAARSRRARAGDAPPASTCSTQRAWPSDSPSWCTTSRATRRASSSATPRLPLTLVNGAVNVWEVEHGR